MNKSNKLILRITTALLLTFSVLAIMLIPHLNLWLWIAEGIIGCWILLLLFFVVTFKRFNKEQKKGS